jgi:hypothetical protein
MEVEDTMANVMMLSTADNNINKYNRRDFERLLDATAHDICGAHCLVDSPDRCDVILFAGSTYPDLRDIRCHPFIRDYADKCFVFCSDDYFIPFLPGIYATLSTRWHSPGRTVPGFYLQVMDNDNISFWPSFEECDYLFSFIGSTRSHPIRSRLMSLKHPRAYLLDYSSNAPASEIHKKFFMVNYTAADKQHYGEVMRRSKFILCPRGYSHGGLRLFEAMKAGRVPVIISDQWLLPVGPSWERFSLRVRQRDVRDLPAILEQNEDRAESMGRLAREAWEAWFSREMCFHRIVEWCLHLKSASEGARDYYKAGLYLQFLRPFFLRHVVAPAIKLTMVKAAANMWHG